MMTYPIMRRNILGLVSILPCLVAGACTRADEAGSSLEQTIAVSSPPVSAQNVISTRDMMALSSSHGASRVMASLPDAAGSVMAVRIKEYVNGVRQDILLKGGSVKSVHNGLTVLARTSSQPTLDESVPFDKPTETDIRSEIGAEFSQIPMQVVGRESSNAYGPYGLALGRVGADVRCLFMWQWIDANRLPQDAGVDGPISVRVRLCQAGTSFDAMAALVDHLTIGATTAAEMTPIAVADGAQHRKIAYRRRPSMLVRREHDRHDAAPVSDRIATVTPRPASTEGTVPLSSDLPPEAYLGPKASVGSN